MDSRVTAVIDKYRNHPYFLGIDIENVDQPGAVDDTVLHIAAMTGAIEDMRVLLDSGANVNAIGDLRHTPLHYAAMRGQLESVRVLLQYGARTELKNEFDQTAADVAELGGHSEIVRVLRANPEHETD